MNKECRLCSLSTLNSVGGQSECDISEIKLIVIGSYPQDTDEANEISFCAYDSLGYNAQESYGKFIRDIFSKVFNEDFVKHIYFSHAIKCNKRDKSILDKHRKICHKNHLLPELDKLPKVPILALGKEAAKSLIGNQNIAEYRQKIFYRLNPKIQPIIVSFEPVELKRTIMKTFIQNYDLIYKDLLILFQEKKINKYNLNKFTQTETWKPVLPGTMAYFFAQDLKLLKKIIN